MPIKMQIISVNGFSRINLMLQKSRTKELITIFTRKNGKRDPSKLAENVRPNCWQGVYFRLAVGCVGQHKINFWLSCAASIRWQNMFHSMSTCPESTEENYNQSAAWITTKLATTSTWDVDFHSGNSRNQRPIEMTFFESVSSVICSLKIKIEWIPLCHGIRNS